ncbi:ABC transporter permease [Bradyrhizobium sp. AS23.2]|nr:ABC transporter permease [Bradyrhizobium sp. AS23.2]
MRKIIAIAALALSAVAPGAFAADNDPIRIGVLNDSSGLYADLSGEGSAVAARMAVEEFGGELLGRKVEVIHADHQNKPDIASSIVRKWVDVDHVALVADGGPSSVATAVQELAREKKFVFAIAGGFASTLTGPSCAATSFQFIPDTYALSTAPTRAAVAKGLDSWYFLAADYTFGQSLYRDAAAAVQAAGGKVLGHVMHPLNTSDFSSFLMQAQASKAKAVGLANGGGDFSNALKQAQEFGIAQGGQHVVGFVVFTSDIQAIGLQAAQGLQFATATHWDVDDKTRAWSREFMKRYRGNPPTTVQSLTYSGVLHWLKAAKEAGTLDGEKVAAKMREMKVNDVFVHGASIRDDGRVLEDLMMVEVKSPAESKYKFDDLKVIGKIDAATAYRPLSEGKCPLVKAAN